MEPELRQHLVDCAAAYMAARGVESSTVGRLAAGDWRFFERIQNGSSFTARKYDEVISWFARNWPDDATWPPGLAIPAEADLHPHGAAA